MSFHDACGIFRASQLSQEALMTPTQAISSAIRRRTETDGESKQLFPCPITGYPCEGDLSYLCEDYGCARKGGLSPRSEENL
jgi:hypothetical protein